MVTTMLPEEFRIRKRMGNRVESSIYEDRVAILQVVPKTPRKGQKPRITSLLQIPYDQQIKRQE